MTGDPSVTHEVLVVLDEGLATLNRAIGVLRRRNVPVGTVALVPDARGGPSSLTFTIPGDAAAVDRVVQQIRKVIGVRDVRVSAAAGDTPKEVER